MVVIDNAARHLLCGRHVHSRGGHHPPPHPADEESEQPADSKLDGIQRNRLPSYHTAVAPNPAEWKSPFGRGLHTNETTHEHDTVMPSCSAATSAQHHRSASATPAQHHCGLPKDAAEGASAGSSWDRTGGKHNLGPSVIVGSKSGDADPEAACRQEHTHGCAAVMTAANLAANVEGTMATQRVLAFVFEGACVVHSILIGFALGVTVNDRSQATVLLVALVFHQLLEGIGLGTVIAKGFFAPPHVTTPLAGMMKAVAMVVSFALTLPIGVAIGIGVASSYEEDSTVSNAVQGVLNSVSGGLLLYIALVQMITEDFTKTDTEVPGGWTVRISSYVLLGIGAAAMAAIALAE
eukprot:352470-Chlamydomonas_euryale.AAC.7